MNLIEEIAYKSSEASLYEMLAEEAAELSAAASKYARYLRFHYSFGSYSPAFGLSFGYFMQSGHHS